MSMGLLRRQLGQLRPAVAEAKVLLEEVRSLVEEFRRSPLPPNPTPPRRSRFDETTTGQYAVLRPEDLPMPEIPITVDIVDDIDNGWPNVPHRPRKPKQLPKKKS